MIDVEYGRIMANYNRWMNDRLYELVATIPDEERRRDRGAFFRSIHSTLNHLIYADLAILSRLTGDPPEVPELGVDLYDEFEALRIARSEIDARLLKWAESLTTQWLREPLSYVSKVDGVTRTVPNWLFVVHLFNHQIHHRGQVHTLLTQLGHDLGTTDLPFMPGVPTGDGSHGC